MNKILDKIKNVPIGVKAAAVYTLASVFSKGLAIITVPIFTRIMSTSEIGVVNLYNSWNSMLNAVVTLSLTSGGYSAASCVSSSDRLPRCPASGEMQKRLVHKDRSACL